MSDTERPLADPGRERMARQLFSEGLSPEEYAARHSHGIWCFSLGDLSHSDPALDTWIRRFTDILHHENGAPTVQELREKLLTPEERQRIKQEIQEMSEDP
jgi:hypothetical protein